VTNIYDPKDAVAAPQARKVVDDTSGSAPDEEFEFQLLDAEGNVVETVKAPAGYVNFSELTFDKVGTYSYTIKEVSGSTAGFTYDTEGRNLQIVVEDAGKGELKATIDYLNDEGEIVITNPYEPDPASITFTVEKIVEGVSANAKAQDFSFVLSDADGEIQTVTITGAGEASFDEITYDKVGTYNYTIAESKGNAAGYTYDTAVFSITVEVTDNGGTLVAAETITKDGSAADAVTFTNVYTASGTEVDLTGKKVMTGRELKEAEFEFKLEIDGKVVETVRNAKDGSIVFTQLTYEQAGEHTFKIYEVAGSELYVRYDKTVYEGKITVEDNGQGRLVATVTGADSIVFNNAYDKPVTPPTPPTGDNSNLNLWITLMAASGLGFTGVLLIGKKRKKSER
jgi:pilin isopeptide linkage protein